MINNRNLQTFFDCGFSKIRAAVFIKNNQNKVFYEESKFFTNHLNLNLEIQKMITSLESNNNEYIDNINLMLDSPKMLSVGISISKKLDGSILSQTNIQFLIQEAKQQILKYYKNYNITHIIINNYKIDGVNYSYLPNEIKCYFISLDILFICLPIDLVRYFKNIFSKSNILVKKIICSSYAKSINYKDNLSLTGHVSFIDLGFNKTSVISYFNDNVLSLDVLPIGGNNITKDISKILEIDLEQAEHIKNNYDKNLKLSNDFNFSSEIIQKVILARIQEILELCIKSIKSNISIQGQFKIVLMGEGSKILNNQYTNKFLSLYNMVLFEENTKNICQSGFKLEKGLNKKEIIVIPKKQTKHGFFEKLFHLFG
jgi:cell division protein FtsA|tara:strand:- start:2319 stop:3431 length:1113 start_codon:yes stop_codon:yes gene_type:complete